MAGLDAAFVLTGSQAMRAKLNRSNRLREANRAIGCVVMYRFPQMEEIARAYAVEPLGVSVYTRLAELSRNTGVASRR